jgi:hypothetical protein
VTRQPLRSGMRVGLVALLAAGLGLAGGLVAGPAAADTSPNVSPVTFDTCGAKTLGVPAGVTSATFDVSEPFVVAVTA